MEGFDLRRFVSAVVALQVVLVVGTVGFRLILDEPWISSLYRAVVTVTLTGLDTKPEGATAELFTILLLVSGVAIFLYVAGSIVELFARTVLTGGARRKRHIIEKLSDHYIVCGYGRVGRRVASELRAADAECVVVDVNPDAVGAAAADGFHVVLGDGTEDADLERAGLGSARGLVASSDSDENNLYITLSAKAMRPEIVIVARASDEAAVRKLRRAGADHVVLPYAQAGLQIANIMLKPQVAAFLDLVSTAGGSAPDLRFEEIRITAECGHGGRTIGDLRVRDVTGALVIALRRRGGGFETTPGPDAALEVGDVLIGVGTAGEIRKLEELFAPRGAVAG